MRLSTQARYGVRAMLDLAAHYHEGCSTIKDISRRQEVSARYLENLMTPLRVAGLVRSVRGNRGGFLLGRDPSDITLGGVLRVLDGNFVPVACVEDPKLCHRAAKCVTRRVWCRLHEAMTGVLDGITLAEMVDEQKELSDGEVESCPDKEHSE